MYLSIIISQSPIGYSSLLGGREALPLREVAPVEPGQEVPQRGLPQPRPGGGLEPAGAAGHDVRRAEAEEGEQEGHRPLQQSWRGYVT